MKNYVIGCILAIAIFCVPNVSFAQIENVGLAYFGVQAKNWPCEISIRAMKDIKNIHVSVLNNTFGADNKCLVKMINLAKFKSLEVHMVNGPAFRNRRVGPYELWAGESVATINRKLEKKDVRLLKKLWVALDKLNTEVLSKMRPEQTCLISPILEHNLTSGAERVLFEEVRKHIPAQCMVVNNPEKARKLKTPKNNTDFTESHGSGAIVQTNCITNLDGNDIDFHARHALTSTNGLKLPSILEEDLPLFIEARKSCLVNYLWIREFNGIKYEAFQDPRERTNWPAKSVLTLTVGYILEAQQPAAVIPAWTAQDDLSLVGCKSIEKSNDGIGGFLWKNSCCYPGAASLYPTKFGRKFKSVTLINKGKIIDRLFFTGVFPTGNRQIWRTRKPMKSYPYNSVINADGACWVLKNPRVRSD